MHNLFVYVLLIIVFLMLSAFFSGMEAAIFSVSRFRIKTLLYEERKGAHTLEKIKREPGKTLAAILLANILVNVGASSVSAIILVHFIEAHQVNTTISFVIQFIIMTSLLLTIGEITPKTIAIANAERLSLQFSGVIALVSMILSPVSKFMAVFTRTIVKRSPEEVEAITDKEIELMLREARRYKVLDEGEESLGFRILRFSKVRVSEIMTPRPRVISIDVNAPIKDAEKIIRQEKHSRICILDEKNNVIGILYAKDLFMSQLQERSDKPVTIRDLMREPYVVPESKHAENLLAEFRKKGIHIGVVVDEFGCFTGIVTLEDILESLYGEIIDEYDERCDMLYEKIAADTYIFHGDISIGELSRILDIGPFAEEAERLSGFIYDYFERIPREDDTIRLAQIEITVDEIHDRIIERVRVKKLRQEIA
ncbi:hypothetical protein AMJ87_03660 [candidate division WOR_3 bacterium SM23_60]|uniref:Hemolysin n=1 Tax=candidate division WOR_3 bacterium SM23_60 TaxID=1703780 RepID=A0A0S8GIA1_UNCW3|nr:MAG: hypothetical protein AMJ87_03660 [candidate division WOR_3 bacterium SM23_60]